MRSISDKTSRVIAVLTIAIMGSSLVAATQIQQAFAAVNGLPMVNPIPDQTVDELTFLTFNVTATDPDGQQLGFSLQNAPYGASINSTTGVFTWTPSEEQGSGVYHINVVVNDGFVISSGTVMIIVNDVGGGGDGEGRKISRSSSNPDIGSTDLGATSLFATPTNIPLDGTTSLIQESEPVNSGKLMSLIVQEPDGDVCYAVGGGLDIPSSGLTRQYPTDFSLATDAGDGVCDTGDVGTYQAQSQLSTNSGTVQNSAEFQTDSPFVLPESPIGIIALMGSTLAVLGVFMAIRGRYTKI
jgi:hypothetical protein